MFTLDELNKRGIGTLPGLIGLTILDAEEGRISSRWPFVRSSWPRTAICMRRR